MKSDEFETIERSLLGAVVSRDTLTIDEVELFRAVDLWATKQCQKQGLASDGKVKRRILGEQIIKAIRFPVMKQDEFADVVLDTNILTQDEIIIFFKFFNSKLTSRVGFSETRRGSSVIRRCVRFPSFTSNRWEYIYGTKELLAFTVDKDILLRGVSLIGSASPNSYTVTLEVKDTSNDKTLVSKTGTFSLKLLHCKNYSYHGFDVLFDCAIVRNTWYRIEAIIFGPALSVIGEGSSSNLLSCGVTFTFSAVNDNALLKKDTDSYRSIRDNTPNGQFPELLFSV